MKNAQIMIRIVLFFLLTNLSFCQSNGNGVIFTEQNEDGSVKKELKDYNMKFYKIKMKDIEGKDFSFEQFKGKKVMVVNTASNCGYTQQYQELQNLYLKLGGTGKNFEIVGVPSNDFGQQEPGTNQEIKSFCSLKYGVTFPMMSKVSVKGPEMCELYQYLTQLSKNGVLDSTVDWNFQKYLINEDGTLYMMLPSSAEPTSSEIMEWLQAK